MQHPYPVEVFVSGLTSPEGPCFDAEGNLYFVNWLTSAILRATPDGEVSEFFNTGGIPAGLAFHPDGSLYVADEGEHIHGLMRITPDGEATILVNQFEGKPLNGANDLVLDANGVAYFSDPWATSLENPVGGFYRYFPDGRLEQLDTGLAFPNGVALTADGSAVILAETMRNRLLRYAIGSDGSVGERTVWASTYEPSGADGMAFDAEGNLYVAHFNGSAVDIFDPSGTLTGKIDIPGHQVTNCAFGGDDGKTLMITEVSTGSVYRTRVDIPGQELCDNRPRR
ncbi:MAG: SMP-30/gluconolactonase/LRE family protein [Thermomicrobiales bacterium]|nr:SMP-30/gluconolactonase/LRE family protein [Thermomicrobiales bacterium]